MSASLLSNDAERVLVLFDETERAAFFEEKAGQGAAEGNSASDLLRWIVMRRTPFIQMASEIGVLLTQIEASIRGNIDFVLLPGPGEDLVLPFGPQIRKLVETAGRWSQEGSYRDLAPQAVGLRRSIAKFCESVRGEFIERDTEAGAALKLLPEHDPRRFAAEHFDNPFLVDRDYEYSPEDVRSLETVHERLSALIALAKSTGAETLPAIFRQTRRTLIDSLDRTRAERSLTEPFARPSLEKRRLDRLLSEIAGLHRSIELETEFSGDEIRLMEAMALSFWKERWRLYELWLFCHVCRLLCRLSGSFDTAGRVSKGRWSLKFTKDDQPVLRCLFQAEGLDVYYQYHEVGAERANMPDVAVRIGSSREWLLVLDPKSGETFTKRSLEEVCLRYAEAFRAELTCVANYFPAEYRVDVLPRQPPAILYHGLRPDTVAPLDAEVGDALGRSGLLRVCAFILFDVSKSTEGVHARLDQALRKALTASSGISLAESVILFFADAIVERIGAEEYLDRPDLRTPSGTTDTGAAMRAAAAELAAAPAVGEIWLVGDGDDDINPSEWVEELGKSAIRVRALIGGAKIPSGFASLCDRTGGTCRLV